MKDNDGILKNSSVAMSILEKKDRTTHMIIKELVDNGFIERVGSNKNGYWKTIL